MRLLFVRHGDPDYKNDCLNEIGRREARALAALGPRIDWGTSFVSPLGRAQETAAIVLGRAVPGAHGVEAAVGCTDLSTRGDAAAACHATSGTSDAAAAAGSTTSDVTGNTAAADSFDLIKTLDWLREFPAVVDPEAASLLADAYAFRKNPDGSDRMVSVQIDGILSTDDGRISSDEIEVKIPDYSEFYDLERLSGEINAFYDGK